MRCIGDRKGAPAAIIENEFDVLAGEEAQPFIARQLQAYAHDVRRQAFETMHAHRQRPDRDIARRPRLRTFDSYLG